MPHEFLYIKLSVLTLYKPLEKIWKCSFKAFCYVGSAFGTLVEISSASRSLLCHNEMVVLSPIMWKILINTSDLLVGQNKFYWNVVCNVLYMSGTQICIVFIVSKVHSNLQKSCQLHCIFQCILLSQHMITRLKQVQPAGHCLIIKGWFVFLQPCSNVGILITINLLSWWDTTSSIVLV